MLRISRDLYVTRLWAGNSPATYAESGDTVVFETYDCFRNKIENESQLFSEVGWGDINPASGPLYVNGAEPGDTLKIDILKISLIGDGVATMAPGFGVINGPWLKEITRVMKVADNKVYFSDKITLPVKPMIGVIGCAPAGNEEIPTGTPGPHGGNMDCKEITEGATLYLPVNVSGALLAMGDLHAAMGDGEVSVSGIEIAGEVIVKLTVLKNINLPMPMLKNSKHLMTICSALTLDEAANGAVKQMHEFATEHLGIPQHEAAMLLSAACDLKICQVVDPLKTCRMEMPLWIVDKYGYVLQ